MRALGRHLRLLLTISLLVCGQADFKGAKQDSETREISLSTPSRMSAFRYLTSNLRQGTETMHSAGVLGAPENLYEDVVKVIQSNVNRLVPASKSETKDVEAKVEALEEYKAESEVNKAKSEEYKKETTAIINSLIAKVNSLTPVSLTSHLRHVPFQCTHTSHKMTLTIPSMHFG